MDHVEDDGADPLEVIPVKVGQELQETVNAAESSSSASMQVEQIERPDHERKQGEPSGNVVKAVRTIHIHLKRKWYEAIRDGVKTTEVRSFNQYWRSRLKNSTHIVFSLGYDPSTKLKPRKILETRVVNKAVAARKHGIPQCEIHDLFGECEHVVEIDFAPSQFE